MATSRRSFLFGRGAPSSEWGQFCARLARTAQGRLTWDPELNIKRARLVPLRENDVRHAHALCVEYGVQLALDGMWLDTETTDKDASSGARPDRPTLLVEPGSRWARYDLDGSFRAEEEVWRVDAGCSVGQLHEIGFEWLAAVDPTWTVARWLSSQQASRWSAGYPEQSPVLQISALLADGTTAQFGLFGAAAGVPLKSMTVQKMIPRLFELSRAPVAQRMLQAEQWDAAYRMDALTPQSGQDLNLAKLFTGHGGSLAWVWSVWLSRKSPQPAPAVATEAMVGYVVADGLHRDEIVLFDQQVKRAFDPNDVFPATVRPKGLESEQV